MCYKRKLLRLLLSSVFCLTAIARTNAQTPTYNYGEVLQKSLFFYEAQESGKRSPGNRVEWRGDAHLDDGYPFRDLSGGWYDAADHWKSNNTMAYAASLLAWSAVQYPTAYTQTGQMDELLNGLKHVNDYFLKCIVDPDSNSLTNFSQFELYIDIAGQPGIAPNVHSVWSAPEITNGYTNRLALKVNKTVIGPDVAAAMAATMASSAILFYQNGKQAYAQRLFKKAEKLVAYAATYPFPSHIPSQGSWGDQREAIAPDNTIRYVAYRSGDERDELLFATGWLHRAAQTLQIAGYSGTYLQSMRNKVAVYRNLDENADGTPEFFGWWKNLFSGQYNQAGLMLYLQIEPTDPLGIAPTMYNAVYKFEAEWPHSQLGMRFREGEKNFYYIGSDFKKLAFGLKWALNQAYLCMMYSSWTNDATQKAALFNVAKSQVDYALGTNKQHKSFVIGFNGPQGWIKSTHHRGAQGSYYGSANIDKTKPQYLPEARHILYGGLMAGPDENDDFVPDVANHYHNEVALDFNAGMQGILAGLIAQNPTAYSAIPDNQFPPKEIRNLTLYPLTTDREFFVVAKTTAATTTSLTLETEIWNKSAWPARATNQLSYRYFFTLDNGATASNITATLGTSDGATIAIKPFSGNVYYAEVKFPNKAILPNYLDEAGFKPNRIATFTITANNATHWNTDNDFSFAGLDNNFTIRPKMAVYNDGVWLEGEVPSTATPVNTPPTVSITSPAANSTFTTGIAITINANAADTDGSVSKVEFFAGTAKLGEDLTSPYSLTWSNATAGTYRLTAKVTDNALATTTSASVGITVTATADTQAPTAPTGLTATSNGITSTTVSLSWTASSDNVGVTGYDVYRGTTLVGSSTTSSFTATGLTANTTYSFTVKARDAAGNVSAGSTALSVTTSATSSTTTPFPLVYLKFNKNTGTVIPNKGSTGAVGFTRTSPTPSWSTDVPATVGETSAVDFGATNGNFAVESNTIIEGLKNLTSFTITGWVKCKSSAEGQGGNRLVSWINNGGEGVDLVYHSDGSLQLGVNQWPDNSPASSTANKIPLHSWAFFAASYDAASGQVKFYFGNEATDATLDVTKAYSQGVAGANIAKVAIGHFNSATRTQALDRMFKGLMDEVKIFGSALNAQQIVATQRTGPATTFYRAVNINGNASTIDGKAWEASSSALNFSFSGNAFTAPTVALVPPTDAHRTAMIRSSIWGVAPSLTMSAVPTGTYDVYLYVWEDDQSQTYSVSLEGQVVKANYVSGSAGTWSKLGPFRATITDGAINVSTTGGDANLSGIEVWKVDIGAGRVSANSLEVAASAVSLSPNPATDGHATLVVYAKEAQETQVVITNIVSQQSMTFTQSLQEGTNQLDLDVKAASKGLYLVTIAVDGQRIVKKLILL